jgi:hypothetical protein
MARASLLVDPMMPPTEHEESDDVGHALMLPVRAQSAPHTAGGGAGGKDIVQVACTMHGPSGAGAGQMHPPRPPVVHWKAIATREFGGTQSPFQSLETRPNPGPPPGPATGANGAGGTAQTSLSLIISVPGPAVLPMVPAPPKLWKQTASVREPATAGVIPHTIQALTPPPPAAAPGHGAAG